MVETESMFTEFAQHFLMPVGLDVVPVKGKLQIGCNELAVHIKPTMV